MDKYDEFYSYIQKVAEEFRKIDPAETIRIVSHLDADGLTSASILVQAMERANRQYVLTIAQRLDADLADNLEKEQYNYIAISDLGSGQFTVLRDRIKSKKIYIFDHHKPEVIEDVQNIVHVNPHLFGIDGSKEVSGSGVAYLFAKSLDEKNKNLAHIAIVGAIGDVQENSGFERVNSDILRDAVESGKMKVIPGLKVFGAQTKPLSRLLAYSTECNIPGITGSESRVIQFLNELGIEPKTGSKWRSLVDLDEDELKKLVTGIVMRRLGEKQPESVIGPVYILCDETKKSPLRDAKEFSTLLNACGRMDKPALGIGACMGDEKLKAKAISHLEDYKKELVKSMKWFEQNRHSGPITSGKNYMIINAEKNIMHTMIGTLASIISKSGNLNTGTYILSIAQVGDGYSKISLRMSGNTENDDMRTVVQRIAETVNGTAGGHKGAAGAIIKTEQEQQFIENAKMIFEEMERDVIKR